MRAGLPYQRDPPRQVDAGWKTRFRLVTNSRFPKAAMTLIRPSATFSRREKEKPLPKIPHAPRFEGPSK